MNVSRISGVVIVATPCLIGWGLKLSVQCVHFEDRVPIV
jgi:hypothetical protein